MKKLLLILLLLGAPAWAQSMLVKSVAGGGGASGDLSDVQFLVLDLTSSLDAEREITEGSGISFADSGENDAFTISVNQDFAFVLTSNLTIGDGSNDARLLFGDSSDCSGSGTADKGELCFDGTNLLLGEDGGTLRIVGDITAITAGNGLTGTATEGAPALAVVAGDSSLTVAADSVVVNQSFNFNWTGYHDYTSLAAPAVSANNQMRIYQDSTKLTPQLSLDGLAYEPASPVQYGMNKRMCGQWMRNGSSGTTTWNAVGLEAAAVLGACTALVFDDQTVSGLQGLNCPSAATTNSNGGWEYTSQIDKITPANEPTAGTAWLSDTTIADRRQIILALSEEGTQPYAIVPSTSGGTDDINGAWIVYDSGQNGGEILVCTGDNADWDCDDTNILVATSTIYRVQIQIRSGTTYFWINGSTFTRTANLPISSVLVGPTFGGRSLNNNAVSVKSGGMSLCYNN